MRKIQVPEGMLKAAVEVQRKRQGYPHPDSKDNAEIVRTVEYALEAALRWLSENMPRPIFNPPDPSYAQGWNDALKWVSRMFLAPEPEIPEEIRDLLQTNPEDYSLPSVDHHNSSVLEAYRRGLRSK